MNRTQMTESNIVDQTTELDADGTETIIRTAWRDIRSVHADWQLNGADIDFFETTVTQGDKNIGEYTWPTERDANKGHADTLKKVRTYTATPAK